MSAFTRRLQRTHAVEVAPPQSNITHGEQLTVSDVGPWSLQGVSQGSEALQMMTIPGRGYWRMDTPNEFSLATPYVYNNDPSNHGGIVPAGGMVIDGYSVAAGTRVVQFRDFSAGDFYVQYAGGAYMFRGCRVRNDTTSGASTFNDYNALSTWQNALHYCDMGCPSKESNGWGAAWKMLGGSGHRVYRTYVSDGLVGFQPNVRDVEITETMIANVVYYYGEKGTSGNGPDSSTLHLNGISVEGGARNLTIQRCWITVPSPDGATGANGSAAGQPGYGTQPGQVGYGNGTNPGRITMQTDCIAIFAITGSNDGVTIRDNYLGGSGYVLYAGNADGGAKNITLTGNKVTTKWWTNGGNFGPITDIPNWGSNGNVKSGNVWADDYGTGGNGCTALADRQYPTGNGPRTGATFV